MFALPGILILIVLVYIRPQELVPQLASVPLLYLGVGAVLFGIAVDWRLRRSRPAATPQLFWTLIFFVWAMLTLAVRDSSALAGAMVFVGTSIVLYMSVAHGIQSFRRFETVAAAILAITLFISFVGVHQGTAPLECHVAKYDTLVSDGRSCVTRKDCERGDVEPGAEYECERAGLLGTSSIGGGRVRWIGLLLDPNELSLAMAVGLPLAFAFAERKRSAARVALLLLSLGLIATCTVFTQSRGGQLVFLTVLGVYFIRRYGVTGAILGAVVAVPILLLGGRSGEEAESSSIERLGCWYAGMDMFKSSPLIGVGYGLFTDHHDLTAHNSYVLAPAELGFPGMVLWSIVLWLSFKIPIEVLRRYRGDPDAQVARTWAQALLASMAGMFVGIFFLSFCYHAVLWIYLGLCGALYSAVRAHDQTFDVELGWRDFVGVVAVDGVLVSVLYVYTRIKGAP